MECLGTHLDRSTQPSPPRQRLSSNAQTIELASPPLMSWIGNDRRASVYESTVLESRGSIDLSMKDLVWPLAARAAI